MGRGDDELTPQEDAHADQLLRELLAHYGEPTYVPPPPNLARRVVSALPRQPQAMYRRAPWAGIGVALVGAFGLLLLALGLWGVFGDSGGPAGLLGGAEAGLGRALLVLTLAAKPIVGSLAALGAPMLAGGSLLVVVVCWAWWLLVQRPLPGVVEALP